jgi:serine/threonine protein kinase
VSDKNTPNVTKLPSISALPAGIALQEFEITGVLGEGGFGIVYLARDRLLGREVAIKEYMPASLAARGTDRGVIVRSQSHEQTFAAGLQSFMTEARLLAQFKHPALVEIFRFWEQNDTAYMAMPYYRGQTLKQFLKANPAVVNEYWLREILLPLLDGLEHLHGAHCYHRDIAPDNILILENGQPLLLDFGAARRIVGDVTAGLTVILKPGYAPVEQYADDATIAQGPWTDVYGLAAICYLAITGHVPPASVTRLMRDPLSPLVAQAIPGFSKQFLLGVDRGLAVKPEQRPQSIAEFRKLLGLDPQLDLGLDEPANESRANSSRANVAPTLSIAPASPSSAPPVIAPQPTGKPSDIERNLASPNTASAASDSSVSKRFPFLQPSTTAGSATTKSTSSAAPTADDAPAPPAVIAPPVSGKPKKGTNSKKKNTKSSVPPSLSALDEDTVVLGTQNPLKSFDPVDAFYAAEVEADDDKESIAEAPKRIRSTLVIAAIAAVLAAVGLWFFIGGESATTNRAAKTNASPAAKITTPEPPLIVTNTDEKFTTPAAATSESLAMLEKLRADEQAKLDAEKAAADEKTKAEEKEKARLAVSGTLVLNISPWGEVLVNGQSRGASPPRKRLSLVEGSYTITIKNGNFEPYVTVIDVRRGQEHLVAHQFR